MASDMRTIKHDRQAERNEVVNRTDDRTLLELQYIADALEGIRHELSALNITVDRMARQAPK